MDFRDFEHFLTILGDTSLRENLFYDVFLGYLCMFEVEICQFDSLKGDLRSYKALQIRT